MRDPVWLQNATGLKIQEVTLVSVFAVNVAFQGKEILLQKLIFWQLTNLQRQENTKYFCCKIQNTKIQNTKTFYRLTEKSISPPQSFELLEQILVLENQLESEASSVMKHADLSMVNSDSPAKHHFASFSCYQPKKLLSWGLWARTLLSELDDLLCSFDFGWSTAPYSISLLWYIICCFDRKKS